MSSELVSRHVKDRQKVFPYEGQQLAETGGLGCWCCELDLDYVCNEEGSKHREVPNGELACFDTRPFPHHYPKHSELHYSKHV